MLKSLVKKHMNQANATEKTQQEAEVKQQNQQISDLAVNEVAADQSLIDAEEEKMRENKFLNDHVEYLRVARKPLLFGMEENLTYTQHAHMQLQGVVQNFNNK